MEFLLTLLSCIYNFMERYQVTLCNKETFFLHNISTILPPHHNLSVSEDGLTVETGLVHEYNLSEELAYY